MPHAWYQFGLNPDADYEIVADVEVWPPFCLDTTTLGVGEGGIFDICVNYCITYSTPRFVSRLTPRHAY